MFAKPSTDKRQSVLQRDILSGFANAIAGARNASVERTPVVPTSVMKAHMN